MIGKLLFYIGRLWLLLTGYNPVNTEAGNDAILAQDPVGEHGTQ